MQTKLYLSDKDLAARYNVTRGTVWRWTTEGNLPAPVRVGPNTTRWRLADIEEHDRQFTATAPADQSTTTPR